MIAPGTPLTPHVHPGPDVCHAPCWAAVWAGRWGGRSQAQVPALKDLSGSKPTRSPPLGTLVWGRGTENISMRKRVLPGMGMSARKGSIKGKCSGKATLKGDICAET